MSDSRRGCTWTAVVRLILAPRWHRFAANCCVNHAHLPPAETLNVTKGN
jgi:hypothetical protein